VFIAAHAVVMDTTCYQTAVLYGLERNTGTVYGVDVLTGTSWMEFDITPPPPVGSAKPNGLAYDAINDRFYYADYQPTTTLYFWDTSQHVAGSLDNPVGGECAAADFNGAYYYIGAGTDDLYKITFNPDGTIATNTKLGDIAGNLHGWTFDGDIAIKNGVIYGWGHCTHGYEFFTYDLATTAFTVVTTSYQLSLQLAFGSNGVLYGHRSAGTGAFYVVDVTNGAVSMVTPTPSPALLYTDCASGMICEPTYETAWGEGTEFSTNWATYFTYIPWVLLETLTVPANTATPTTSSMTLENGKVYTIKASGTYNFRNPGDSQGYLADAEWALRHDAYGEGWTKGDNTPYSLPYNGLDLCNDAGTNTNWGNLDSTNHQYSTTYKGTGSTISFFIKDSGYTDNSGSLTVEIWG
jgi:hypothetical protein